MRAYSAHAPHADGLGGTDACGGDDGGVGGGDRVGNDRGLVEREAVGDGNEGVLAGEGVLGPAAVVVDAGGEHPGAGAAAHAVGALAAGLAGLQCDAGADGQAALEVGAERVDHAGDLVADGDRVGGGEQRDEGAVDQVYVRQADACGLDLDEDLAGAGHGDGDLFHGELLGVEMEASGEHGVHVTCFLCVMIFDGSPTEEDRSSPAGVLEGRGRGRW
ncbi:hypothetical protein GCM10029978_112590 [Actinoallomurus acanthiterrae]